jgi:hypothetical protein
VRRTVSKAAAVAVVAIVLPLRFFKNALAR